MRWLTVVAAGVLGCVDPFPEVRSAAPEDARPIPDALPDMPPGPLDAAPPTTPGEDAGLPSDEGVDPDTPRAPEPGELVINEVDYDRTGDDGAEFIELLSRVDVPLDLTDLQIDLVNGANDINYDDAAIGIGRLEPRGRLVIRLGPQPAVPDGVITVVPDPPWEQIQNGSSDPEEGDGIILTVNGAVIDSLAYEGPARDAGEGRPGPEDPPDQDGLSISRCADGADTGDNARDFQLTFSTPGAENDCREIDGDQL